MNTATNTEESNTTPMLAGDDELSAIKTDTFMADTREPIKGSSLKQILVALTASWGNINTGLSFGYTAVSLPRMALSGSRIVVDVYQSSWITSVSSFGTLFGCILSGYLCDRLGRKKTLIVLQWPAIMGWLMIGFAPSIQWIYVGRILVGISSGMVGAPSRVYVAEISQPYIRGMLAGFSSVGVSLGVVLVYIFGAMYNWDTLAFVSAIIPTMSMCLICFIPESPTWLMSKRNETRCRASLRRLRDSRCDVDAEVNNLKVFFKTNESTSFKDKFQLIKQPSIYKPFVIISLYFLLSQLSGYVIITSYAVDIIKNSGTNIDGYTATILLGFVRLVFTIIGCILMRWLGRKQLSYISSIGCGIPMLCFAGYVYQNSKWLANGETAVAAWFPVMSLFIFYACSTVGYTLVPWVMVGELYPKQIRGLMGGVSYCVANIDIFIVIQTYPLLQELITKHGTFAFYGIISILSTCFFYYFCPETKDKTLQEIEESFGKRKTKTCMSEGKCQHVFNKSSS